MKNNKNMSLEFTHMRIDEKYLKIVFYKVCRSKIGEKIMKFVLYTYPALAAKTDTT